MADNDNNLIENLRNRGLTCRKLKKLEDRERRDSGEFRKIGFNEIAKANEQAADKIKSLRSRVCKLK